VAQHFAGVASCLGWGQQVELAAGQHAAGGLFCLPANFTVTIVPAARMMTTKSNLFQRFPFFCGEQHPSPHPQS
jgi:hypothetical protein